MGCYERDWGKVTNEKNGGQGNKRMLKEKEIEVSVEIVLKKIAGYSTAQREVTIVSQDASRFSRDASRFSRDASRFPRDESRFSRDASRFSRGESRFSRVHCKYRPKASSSGVFELLCLYTLHESLFWGIVSKVELLGWRGKRSYDFHS